MKTLYTSLRLTLLGICSTLVFSGCFINIGAFDSIIGNGNIVTKTREASTFTKIENRTSADVEITTKAVQKVELTTDENLHEYYVTEVINGTLIISKKAGVTSFQSRGAQFVISMQRLENVLNTNSGNLTASSLEAPTQVVVENSGSGDISLGTVQASTFSVTGKNSGNISISSIAAQTSTAITNSGSGNTSVNALQSAVLSVNGRNSGNITLRAVATETITGTITGSGDLYLQGTGSIGTIETTNSGNIDARNFTLQNATARVSGSGDIRISVVQILNAFVTNSGNITYYGNPSVNVNDTGSGNVSRGN